MHDRDAESLDHLGDFTTTRRVLPISAIAVGIGVIAAYVAAGLLKLIAFFTNLFFFQRFSTTPVSPATHHLGAWVIVIPAVGGLIVGLMARYGSDRIRGHGIPEAIEAILLGASRVAPRIALLKPVSSAISIGSGGPFGAEGPIILTGGACGSLVAQFFHLTSTERKTLLVAGAAAGMSAIFAAPVSAVVLGVELLLFEWKPRSVIPVALASVVADIARQYILGMGPVFPSGPHAVVMGPAALAGCVLAGGLAGLLAVALTSAVYASEDAFEHLPIHWMWWPVIGGLVIGVGGYICPQALGVGYDVISGFLQTDMPMKIVVGVLVVKSVIWAVSLGSGTSGGVLAPLLMVGAALGGIEARLLPVEGIGFWPLVSMAATLGGTMRAPLTAVIFAIEITHDINMLLPVLLAVSVAYTCTVLLLRRSILTEKISRRGFHLSHEYAIDPLEIIFAREVARPVVALPALATRAHVASAVATAPAAQPREGRHAARSQRLFPVVDADGKVVGVATKGDLARWLATAGSPTETLAEHLVRRPVLAYADEPLRVVAFRLAETALTRLPVVSRDGQLVGVLGLQDLLTARARILDAEHRRERVLGRRFRLPVFGDEPRAN